MARKVLQSRQARCIICLCAFALCSGSGLKRAPISGRSKVFEEARPEEILFVSEKDPAPEAAGEISEAKALLPGRGFRVSCLQAESGEELRQALSGLAPCRRLLLADSAAFLGILKKEGLAAAAWSHGGNREETFPGAD